MSKQDGIKRELIAKAAAHIPHQAFEEALKEARVYHKAHPPLEEKLIGQPTGPLHPEDAELMEKEKDLIDLVNEGTIAKLVDEHRQKIMAPFRKRMVPVELASEIVDNLVLWS